MANLEGRIQPILVEFWTQFDLKKKAFTNLEKIDQLQATYLKRGLSKQLTIQQMLPALDDLFSCDNSILSSLNTDQLQRNLHITPTLNEGMCSYRLDSLLTPVATFLPGPLDLILVAHGLFEGAVISYENVFQAKNLVPALDIILDREDMNLVELLYGYNQLRIPDWIEDGHFRKLIKNATVRTINGFNNMVKQENFKKPEQIKLFASGISEVKPEKYADFIAEILEEMQLETGLEVSNDLSQLGKRVGWIYGGTNIPEYSEPVSYKNREKA